MKTCDCGGTEFEDRGDSSVFGGEIILTVCISCDKVHGMGEMPKSDKVGHLVSANRIPESNALTGFSGVSKSRHLSAHAAFSGEESPQVNLRETIKFSAVWNNGMFIEDGKTSILPGGIPSRRKS
jgi:hypothetical protein